MGWLRWGARCHERPLEAHHAQYYSEVLWMLSLAAPSSSGVERSVTNFDDRVLIRLSNVSAAFLRVA